MNCVMLLKFENRTEIGKSANNNNNSVYLLETTLYIQHHIANGYSMMI